jgi:hypothetical protein
MKSDSLRELRTESAESARRCFAFFCRSLRGLRFLNAERLRELQADRSKASPNEAKLLAAWDAFRAGEVAPGAGALESSLGGDAA